ncbi:transcriptional regulator, partial [Mycobacterium sp. ITM-2017-0098]
MFPHGEMGPLVVEEVILSSAADPGTTMLVYVPTPGSASDDALRILGTLRA